MPQQSDQAEVAPFRNPALDIRLDVIPIAGTCPATYAEGAAFAKIAIRDFMRFNTRRYRIHRPTWTWRRT